MDTKNFKPTNDMIKNAELVFLCMAEVETIKPIVKGYQKKVLAKHNFKCASEWRKEEGLKTILDPKHDYLLSEEDFKIYLQDCRIEQEKAGLKTDSPEHCPLLVAEDNLRKSENDLITSFELITGLKLNDVNRRLDTRKNFIDLTLKLMSQYVDSKQVLKSLQEA